MTDRLTHITRINIPEPIPNARMSTLPACRFPSTIVWLISATVSDGIPADSNKMPFSKYQQHI